MRDEGRILYLARRYDEAITQLKRIIEVNKDYGSASGWIWTAYKMKGDDPRFDELVRRIGLK